MAALFLTVYVVRRSYAAFTFLITIDIVMLYKLLDLFNDHLLVLRLAETSLGAVLGGTAAALLLPISTKRVLLNVTVEALRRLNEAVGSALDFMAGNSHADPIAASQKFEEALQSARVQVQQLMPPTGGANQTFRMRMMLMTTCRYYLQKLASLALECQRACSVSSLYEQRDRIDADIRAIIEFNEGGSALKMPSAVDSAREGGMASTYLRGIDLSLHGLSRTLV
jgi:uncharacterized membrane protein YccC